MSVRKLFKKQDVSPTFKDRIKNGELGRFAGTITLGGHISQHKDRHADLFKGTLDTSRSPWKASQQTVIIKTYNVDNNNTLDRVVNRIQREADLWESLKHPNVADFLGVCYHKSFDAAGIVSPWYSNGTLSVFLKNNPDIDKLGMVYGIASGLDYLHRLTIVHGDLNPEHSIMVLDNGQPALVDFGRSKNLSRSGYTTKASSTSDLYRAPELVDEYGIEASNSPYTTQQDVYSFGMTMLFVLSGQLPFYTYGPVKLGVQQANLGTQLRHTDYPGIEATHWDLGTRCWAQIPEARCSSATIMEVLSSVRTTG